MKEYVLSLRDPSVESWCWKSVPRISQCPLQHGKTTRPTLSTSPLWHPALAWNTTDEVPCTKFPLWWLLISNSLQWFFPPSHGTEVHLPIFINSMWTPNGFDNIHCQDTLQILWELTWIKLTGSRMTREYMCWGHRTSSRSQFSPFHHVDPRD